MNHHRTPPLAALLVLIALTASACSGGTTIETTPVETSPITQPTVDTTDVDTTVEGSTPTTEGSAGTTTEAPATTAEKKEDPRDGGSIDDPLPVGEPKQSSFTYDDRYSDATWEGIVTGMVATPKAEFTDEDGECVVVIGNLTPTRIGGGAVSSPYDAPTISLIVDGDLVDTNAFSCDTEELDDAGYDWILNAEVTVGTAFPFYISFLIPVGSTTEIDVVVVGDPQSDETLFFAPTILDAATAPTLATGESAAATNDVLPVGDPAQSSFTYDEEYSESMWEGNVLGSVSLPTSEYSDTDGECVAVLGRLTPTAIEEGIVSSGYDAPRVSLIANGHLIDSDVFECDTDGIEADGYGWILNAEVTTGTVYPFYVSFMIEDGATSDVEVVVVGEPQDDRALFFEPTILSDVPAAE